MLLLLGVSTVRACLEGDGSEQCHPLTNTPAWQAHSGVGDLCCEIWPRRVSSPGDERSFRSSGLSTHHSNFQTITTPVPTGDGTAVGILGIRQMKGWGADTWNWGFAFTSTYSCCGFPTVERLPDMLWSDMMKKKQALNCTRQRGPTMPQKHVGSEREMGSETYGARSSSVENSLDYQTHDTISWQFCFLWYLNGSCAPSGIYF